MTIAFTPWPAELAQRYRDKGYWQDLPLTEMLDRHAQQRPDALAIIDGERQLDYRHFKLLTQRLAGHFQALGIVQGDTALVQLSNRADFYIVFFALLSIGVAPVNALYSHRSLELANYATQIKPRLLIAEQDHPLFSGMAFIDQLRAAHPGLEVVLSSQDPEHAGRLESLLDHEPATPVRLPSLDAGQVAFFQLSGGSTGTPKLIPRTHNDYFYSVRRSVQVCRLLPQDRFLCALPAAHNYPLSSPGALGFFDAGACVVMTATPEPYECFRVIEQHAVTHVALVPPAVALWVQAAQRSSPGLGSLKLIQVGGASFSEHLARQVPQTFGCRLQQVFGMAEGMVAYTDLEDDGEALFASQGRPMSEDDEVRVLDAEGHPVAAGEVGMLATRGPYTVRGYYLSPEHNATVFDSEGFYHTGDLVKRSVDGRLKVVGRVKDQINRGAEKIAAEEVERLLLSHPSIHQAALVAYADPLMGEKSCAFLVSEESLSLPQVRGFLRDRGIADYKLPDRLEYIEHMPLTPVGKINKVFLRQTFKQSPP
ncbi:(2,3-dihydroxybenzoyl)adenylate synthase [Pseudomonas sp. NPDC089734]|uniref:(2,3-dihydroxybenzoyl)adenylate synthase n=1 Tax=Pseudomonas sp. NPDC089734 TaxID=3364469 RepID=UPI003816E319